MSITIVEDTNEGASAERSTVNRSLVKTYKVRMETAAGTALYSNNDQFLIAAMDHEKIPKEGQYLDADPSLQVEHIGARIVDNIAYVTVTYRRLAGAMLNINDNGPCQMEIEAGVAEYQTQLDIFGNQILTKHTFPDKLDANGRPRTITQAGTVNVQKPILTIRLSRRERQNPLQKAIQYTGTVNANNWANMPPHTWLCKIRALSDDGQKSWMMGYELSYLEDSWDPVVIATDPATGERVVNPVWGQGIIRAYVQREEVFSNLNLGIG